MSVKMFPVKNFAKSQQTWAKWAGSLIAISWTSVMKFVQAAQSCGVVPPTQKFFVLGQKVLLIKLYNVVL